MICEYTIGLDARNIGVSNSGARVAASITTCVARINGVKENEMVMTPQEKEIVDAIRSAEQNINELIAKARETGLCVSVHYSVIGRLVPVEKFELNIFYSTKIK